MWSNISIQSRKSEAELKQEVGVGKIGEAVEVESASHCSRSKNELSKLASSPLMRYKHAVCSAPTGYIYIHGGRFGSLALDDDVWRFDPHQNSWLRLETRGSKPPSLQEHTLVEYNERLYLFGGQVSASMNENSFWQLDLVSNEWNSLSMQNSKLGSHLGPTNRRGHSAVVYGDSMYVYGGFEDFRGSSEQLWKFNLLAEHWELSDLSASSACKPEPRHSHSAVVHGHSMYVYGGLSNLKPLGDLWRWSWRERRWFKERTRGRSPGQLHGHSAIAAFGSMFVFGGERRNGQTSRGLWRLNLSNLSWKKIQPKGPKPSACIWHGAIANPLSILDEANYIIEGADLLRSDNQSSSFAHLYFENNPSTNRKLQHEDEGVVTERSSASSGAISESARQAAGLFTHKYSCQSRVKSSRLSFLQRRRRQERARSSYELKHLATGAAVTQAAIRVGPVLDKATDEQQMVSLDEPHPYPCKQEHQQASNVSILETLDTDIKLMFERALSPNSSGNFPTARQTQTASSTGDLECPMSLDQSHHQTTTLSRYETAQQGSSITAVQSDGSVLKHSMELTGFNSQRTSYAYTTPPSEMNSIPLDKLSTSELVMRARKIVESEDTSRAVVSSKRRDDRPKSEIVQSLIERADARIKHLYTPFFGQSNASQEARFKRYSLDEKTKRHTLPQTMTYYNLFFDEEIAVEQPHTKSMRRGKLVKHSDVPLEGEITGAALIGVHEDSESRNAKTSELSLEATSSESRTLCGPEMVNATFACDSSSLDKTNGSGQPVLSIPSALTVQRDTTESCDNTSLSFSIIAEFEEDDILQYSSPMDDSHHAQINENSTNRYHQLQPMNSFTFHDSYYSSTNYHQNRNAVQLMQPSSTANPQLDQGKEKGEECPNDKPGEVTQIICNKVEMSDRREGFISAHKSSSSGYDSALSVSYERQQQQHSSKELEHNQTAKADSLTHEPLDTTVESSLAGGFTSTTETSPDQRGKHRLNQRIRPNSYHQNCPSQKCTTSSSTVDSLAFTNTSDALSSPLNQYSAPINGLENIDNNLAQTKHKKPLKERLFGKQKSKTRYWQLCMFVFGGKQGTSCGVNEPITIWRLYI